MHDAEVHLRLLQRRASFSSTITTTPTLSPPHTLHRRGQVLPIVLASPSPFPTSQPLTMNTTTEDSTPSFTSLSTISPTSPPSTSPTIPPSLRNGLIIGAIVITVLSLIITILIILLLRRHRRRIKGKSPSPSPPIQTDTESPPQLPPTTTPYLSALDSHPRFSKSIPSFSDIENPTPTIRPTLAARLRSLLLLPPVSPRRRLSRQQSTAEAGKEHDPQYAIAPEQVAALFMGAEPEPLSTETSPANATVSVLISTTSQTETIPSSSTLKMVVETIPTKTALSAAHLPVTDAASPALSLAEEIERAEMRDRRASVKFADPIASVEVFEVSPVTVVSMESEGTAPWVIEGEVGGVAGKRERRMSGLGGVVVLGDEESGTEDEVVEKGLEEVVVGVNEIEGRVEGIVENIERMKENDEDEAEDEVKDIVENVEQMKENDETGQQSTVEGHVDMNNPIPVQEEAQDVLASETGQESTIKGDVDVNNPIPLKKKCKTC
ncbi:hypothetical protein BC829DRAFT_278471 [Chytridium lagenaria]|nr:hypothetical protein BC829DRAFT_278471 [Chytridium lagenaria]